MYNKSGTTVTNYGAKTQILADVENQSSVGCVVPSTLGVTVGTSKIVKAGTPITVDLMNTITPATLANGTKAMNAVLLHDVDVTTGNQNGTALLFGFVNVNRLEADVQTLVQTAIGNAAASKLVTFLKL
jgi:hypothetical protein